MVTAVLTFGMIFQQVVFPTLARSWRDSPSSGRRSLDALVRVLMLGLVPMAVGASILAVSLVRFLLPQDYSEASLLLALGIWRAPLLTLAFLYQTALIAQNRESAGVRLLVAGAIGSGPLVALMLHRFGLKGAAFAIVGIALSLVVAGYGCLAREGRQPSWHHHLARPILASMVMAPACLLLLRLHVLAAVLGGAGIYLATLAAIGGLEVRRAASRLRPGLTGSRRESRYTSTRVAGFAVLRNPGFPGDISAPRPGLRSTADPCHPRTSWKTLDRSDRRRLGPRSRAQVNWRDGGGIG